MGVGYSNNKELLALLKVMEWIKPHRFSKIVLARLQKKWNVRNDCNCLTINLMMQMRNGMINYL